MPQECLILTMQQNQKYFALADGDGRLAHRFLVVSNLEPRDPSAIVQGNERVLRARLADARFFYDQDRKTAARRARRRSSRASSTTTSSAPGDAGRAAALARAQHRRGDRRRPLEQCDRAALLAKADLVTDMVGEFPELQGMMGRYYAQHDGEPQPVADAIAQHYRPRFAGDALPEGRVAQAVALADKLEALAGMFGIGRRPPATRTRSGCAAQRSACCGS